MTSYQKSSSYQSSTLTYYQQNNRYHSKYKHINLTSAMQEHHDQKNLITEMVYKQGHWICANPLTCGGCATVPARTLPVCVWASQCCCVENLLQSDSFWDDMGIVWALNKLCCFVCHCALPPSQSPDMPPCACCDSRCLDIDHDFKVERTRDGEEDADLLNKSFLCLYCYCAGIGISGFWDPLVKVSGKLGCIRNSCFTTDACPKDHDCCWCYEKIFCLLCLTTCPSFGGESDGIPCVTCCGNCLHGPPQQFPESVGYCAPPVMQTSTVTSARSYTTFRT